MNSLAFDKPPDRGTVAARMDTNATAFPNTGERRGVEFAEVIDLLTQDAQSGRVELVMFEGRPWDGGEEQLFQLQEKLNAYLSFALDGEMADSYPELAGKPLSVVLRCLELPPPEAVEFLGKVREQIALQGIDLVVSYARESESSGGCGSANCGCG